MSDKILLELFSGTGGFAKGLMDSGMKFDKVYFSEVDKHAIANYRHNFKEATYIGTVTNVRHIIRTINRKPTDRLILTFGSPCQDFSMAGGRSGLGGSKSSLIKYAIFLIRWLRPDVFIWENVKGAYSSNYGADYWAIIKEFANLDGYRHEQQLLNTSWVLPQNRERIYLVGHLAGRSEPGIFPIGESLKWYAERGQEPKAPIVNTLTAGGHSGGQHSGMTLIRHRSTEPFEQGDISPTLRNSDKGEVRIIDASHRNEGLRYYTDIMPTLNARDYKEPRCVEISHLSRTDEAKEIRKESMKKGKDYNPFQGKKLDFVDSNVMKTITTNTTKDTLIREKSIIRRLTEIECERLQGFPDDWTAFGDYDGAIKPIPKTQRYKMCGNAVTCAIVKLIGTRIKLI